MNVGGPVLLVALVLLAGCGQPTQDRPTTGISCGPLAVPSLAAGSWAVYEGGRPFSPHSSNVVLQVEAGSRLGVAVAAELAPRLNAYGTSVSAFHVTYWTLDDSGETPIYDEWIDEATGAVVASLARDASTGQLSWNGAGEPPLLGMTALPNPTLVESDTRSFKVPLLPWPDPAHHPRGIEWTPGSLHGYNVLPELLAGGHSEGCRVAVTLMPDFGGPWASMVFDGKAWPARSAESLGDLVEGSVAGGAGIPLYRPESMASPAAGISGEQFLQRLEGRFATDFEDAEDAARKDPAIQKWLSDHPNAAITAMRHAVSAPDSGDIDQWDLLWRAGTTAASLHVQVRRPEPPALLPQLAMLQVTSHDGHAHDRPAGLPKTLHIDPTTLADAYATLASSDSDTWMCDFGDGLCILGNREQLDWPYANGFDEGRLDTFAAAAAPWAVQGLFAQTAEGRLLSFRLDGSTVAPVAMPEGT